MYLGIDIGSSSSKAAVMDERKKIRSVSVLNLGTGTSAGDQVFEDVIRKAGIEKSDLNYIVATGYGRIHFRSANRQITEITCHARGADFLAEGVRTIIDIGGQDAKVIKIGSGGQVENFVMNEKCAAGTGRFLEVMARVLDCGIDELSGLAQRSTREVPISSMCTVFAESEVISRLSEGEKREDVARGAHRAISKRVAGMVGRVGFEPKVLMTGGVALNEDMVRTLSHELETEIQVAPFSQAVGAVGAAVLAWELSHKKDG